MVGRPPKYTVTLDMPLEEAWQRFLQVAPSELADVAERERGRVRKPGTSGQASRKSTAARARKAAKVKRGATKKPVRKAKR